MIIISGTDEQDGAPELVQDLSRVFAGSGSLSVGARTLCPAPVEEVTVGLGDLTDPEAVRAAVRECDAVGVQQFLDTYGFGPSWRYYLQVQGRLYDAKAITGVAYGVQHPDHGPLGAGEFSGGEAGANTALRRLGFTVIDSRPATVAGELAWRLAIWQHLRAAENAEGLVKPAVVREVGAFGGGQGIWVDADRTKAVHPGGVAVGVLHTGAHWTAPAMLEAQIVGSQPAWVAVPRDRWNASSYSRGGMFPQ